MANSSGYDGKKEFECVSCGAVVVATKFASALKVQCDRCKAEKLPPNDEILARIKSAKSKTKTVSSTPDADVPEGKKMSKCTVCGKNVLIGKFASHAKTICPECKGVDEDDDGEWSEIKIDMSKVNRELLPDISTSMVSPVVINNPKLRAVECPACGHTMKIIKIIDANPSRGLVIMYQCHHCLVAITLSEQSITKLKPVAEHQMFNYRAEEITNLMTDERVDLRCKNTIDYLMDLLDKNGIQVEGNIDYTKPNEVMPTGYNPNVEEVLNNGKEDEDIKETV